MRGLKNGALTRSAVEMESGPSRKEDSQRVETGGDSWLGPKVEMDREDGSFVGRAGLA